MPKYYGVAIVILLSTIVIVTILVRNEFQKSQAKIVSLGNRVAALQNQVRAMERAAQARYDQDWREQNEAQNKRVLERELVGLPTQAMTPKRLREDIEELEKLRKDFWEQKQKEWEAALKKLRQDRAAREN
jgi:hypothetical protein